MFVPSLFSLISSAATSAATSLNMWPGRVYGDVVTAHTDVKPPLTTVANTAVTDVAAKTPTVVRPAKPPTPRVSRRIVNDMVIDESTGTRTTLLNRPFSDYLQSYVANAQRGHHMPDDVYDALCICMVRKDWASHITTSNTTKSRTELEKLIKVVRRHNSNFHYRLLTQDTSTAQNISILLRCQRKKNRNHHYIDADYRFVVKLSDAEARIIEAHHAAGHQGCDNTWQMIWKPPNGTRGYDCIARDWVREYIINRCRVCQSKAPKPNKNPLTPIISTGIMERIQLDAIDYRNRPHDNLKWIFYAVDHFSKFHWIICTDSKEATHTMSLLRQIFTTHGPPQILHTDNGGEFINKQVEALLSQYRVAYVHGKPRHPQTQGCIERANGTLKTIIEKWMQHNKSPDWVTGAHKSALLLNNTRCLTTGKTPFELMFGRFPSHVVPGWTAEYDAQVQRHASPDAESIDNTSSSTTVEESAPVAKRRKITASQRARSPRQPEEAPLELPLSPSSSSSSPASVPAPTSPLSTSLTSPHSSSSILLPLSSSSLSSAALPMYCDDIDDAYWNQYFDNGFNLQNPLINYSEDVPILQAHQLANLGLQAAMMLNKYDGSFLRFASLINGDCAFSAIKQCISPFTAITLNDEEIQTYRTLIGNRLISKGEEWFISVLSALPNIGLPITYEELIKNIMTPHTYISSVIIAVIAALEEINIFIIRTTIRIDQNISNNDYKQAERRVSADVILMRKELLRSDTANTIAIHHTYNETVTTGRKPDGSVYCNNDDSGSHFESVVFKAADGMHTIIWPFNSDIVERLQTAAATSYARRNTQYHQHIRKTTYDNNLKQLEYQINDVAGLMAPDYLRKRKSTHQSTNMPVKIIKIYNGTIKQYQVVSKYGVLDKTFTAQDFARKFSASSHPDLENLPLEGWESGSRVTHKVAYENYSLHQYGNYNSGVVNEGDVGNADDVATSISVAADTTQTPRKAAIHAHRTRLQLVSPKHIGPDPSVPKYITKESTRRMNGIDVRVYTVGWGRVSDIDMSVITATTTEREDWFSKGDEHRRELLETWNKRMDDAVL